MDSIKTIRRNNQIAAAFKKAEAFYNEALFMEFSRFSSYFEGIEFEDNKHKEHALKNWYHFFCDTAHCKEEF